MATAPTGARRALLESLNDTGNALRLVRRLDGGARYCVDTDQWLRLEANGHWAADVDGWIVESAKQIGEELFDQAAQAAKGGDVEASKRLASCATTALQAKGIKSMLELARTVPGVPVRKSAIDANPDLLGVKNGVVDLRSGEFRPARREDLIGRSVAAEFDPDAKCPKFTAFLESVFAGNGCVPGRGVGS